MYKKAEMSSPTVSSGALMASIVIDAKENRAVATAHVAVVYLNADMNDLVVMKLRGEFVDMLWEVNPECSNFIVSSGQQQILYLRLDKALYGCVQSSLLWYKLFVETLEWMGFKLNPYDTCVANATIDGKQCTIVWYVDDMKISHADAGVVDAIVEKIETLFGKMTVTRGTRGKLHEFLGMTIDYSEQGLATITMKANLKAAIQ
mmetsp:Transcript_26079/g.37077  ORF Transcript_26079/g.37077 Transcript_26079/m.37077 type:complete len:204 (-) Transcript_26079:2068-2679(-)